MKLLDHQLSSYEVPSRFFFLSLSVFVCVCVVVVRGKGKEGDEWGNRSRIAVLF